jgi:hypothetical protein
MYAQVKIEQTGHYILPWASWIHFTHWYAYPIFKFHFNIIFPSERILNVLYDKNKTAYKNNRLIKFFKTL